MYKKFAAALNYLELSGRIKNDAEFAEIMEISRSRVSGMRSGKRAISAPFIRQMTFKFPEINPDFIADENCTQLLVEGAGDVLTNVTNVNFKSPSAQITAGDQSELVAELRKEIERLTEENRWLKSMFETIVKRDGASN